MLRVSDSPTLLLWGHGVGEADRSLNAQLVAIRDAARASTPMVDLRAMARAFARASVQRRIPSAVITYSLRFALLLADAIDDETIDGLVEVAREELTQGAAAPVLAGSTAAPLRADH
jgi:hypothetical protein